jgi:hypothetical protein
MPRERALISDSVFKQRINTDVIHRPCCLVGVGCALVSLALTCVRERSAERRYVVVGTFAKAPRALRSTHASRRSTGGVYNLGTALPGPDGHSHATYPSRFPRRSSGPVQPLKAALVVERTVTRGVPGRCVRNTSRRRHTRLHQPDAPRRRPQLSKACRQYRLRRTEQEKRELQCSFVGDGG